VAKKNFAPLRLCSLASFARNKKSSKGWEFRKVGAAFSYLLFLVSYSLFSLRLSGKKNFNTFSLFNSTFPK
jgi:hypothetical protein